MREFVKEFFTNFVHEFKYEIHTNLHELFAQKIGHVTNGLCCTFSNLFTNSEILQLKVVLFAPYPNPKTWRCKISQFEMQTF